MTRAIPQNLEEGSSRLLRRLPGGPTISSHHQRRCPGSEGNLRVSEQKVWEFAQASTRNWSSQGVPNWRAAPGRRLPGGRHRVDRGPLRLSRAMAVCSAGSRTERSDHGNRGTERPLPSHTWKGPLPCHPSSQANVVSHRRHADTNFLRRRDDKAGPTVHDLHTELYAASPLGPDRTQPGRGWHRNARGMRAPMAWALGRGAAVQPECRGPAGGLARAPAVPGS
jgi:hypothetical protein